MPTKVTSLKRKELYANSKFDLFLYPQPPGHLDYAKLALEMMQQNIIVEASLNNVLKWQFELKKTSVNLLSVPNTTTTIIIIYQVCLFIIS